MAEAPKTPELVEVTLDRPFTTNGEVLGYEKQTRDGKNVLVFTGKAKVTPEVAEDLERRKEEYRNYEASLHRNKGSDSPVFL